jgi:ferredoxin
MNCFFAGLVTSFAYAAGFALALIIFAGIRERTCWPGAQTAAGHLHRPGDGRSHLLEFLCISWHGIAVRLRPWRALRISFAQTVRGMAFPSGFVLGECPEIGKMRDQGFIQFFSHNTKDRVNWPLWMGTSELHRGSKEDLVIEAVLVMLGIGATCGVVLSVASKVFYVWEDPRIAQVEYFMAGANCGGCGFAGCSAAANAIVAARRHPVSVSWPGPKRPANRRNHGRRRGYGREVAFDQRLPGRPPRRGQILLRRCTHLRGPGQYSWWARVCSVGCLGMGDCMRSCKFDAIHMGAEGYPVVDEANASGAALVKGPAPRAF